MGNYLVYLIPAVIALAVFGVFMMIAQPKRRTATIEERLSQFAERPRTLEELELEQPFYERVVKPMVAAAARIFSKLTPAQAAEKLRLQIVLAGNPYNIGPAEFTGMRLLSALILGGAALGLSILTGQNMQSILMYAGVMFILGYLVPVFWLRSRIKKRQKVILQTLPDAIDLMTISVEAGLAFDGAMQRVAEKWNNDLSREFARALAEMRVGKTKRDALKEMVARAGVADLSTFVASIIQADQLGVSIAKVLRVQSEQMRVRRRQRAEEAAHRAPILIMIPLVFLIFPATYIIILGPSVPKVLSAFGGQ